MFVWDETNDKIILPSTHTISVTSSGHSPDHDVLTIRKNGKKDWSLFYCEAGVIHFDDIKIDVQPGQAIIYPPNIPQKYTIYKDEGTYYQYLHFTGNNVDELIKSLQIETMKPITVKNDLFLGLIKKIQKEILNDDAYACVTAEYLALHLLTIIAKRTPHISKTNIMLRCIDHMKLNYPMPYDASVYANMFSISISRFNHLFKEVMGISPMNYYVRIRMENAQLLLECTDLSITEISRRVGYEDPLYFGQAFKKITGISPSGYRKKFQNQQSFDLLKFR